MNEDWYCFHDGNQAGPVSETVIRQMLQSGRLRWDDLVWRDGMADWVKAEQVSELASSRVAPVPAPAPIPPPFTAAVPAAAAMPQSLPRPVIAAAPALSPIPSLSNLSVPIPGTVPEGALAILTKTRPWVRFISILVFIGCGLMLLSGLAAMVMSLTTVGGGFTGIGVGVAVLVAYAFGACLMLPMGMFLSRYAKAIRAVQGSRRIEDLEAALGAQKSYWKYLGILTVVGLSLSILGVVAGLIFGLAAFFTNQ